MNRISTIPVTLDPSLYRPQAPARNASDLDNRQSRLITLAPTVYDPKTFQGRRARGSRPPPRSKPLPPIPKSPWPVPREQRDGRSNGKPIRMYEAQRVLGSPEERAYWEPPSRQGTFHTKMPRPEQQAHSRPPSRKGTFNSPPGVPPRPGTSQSDELRYKASAPIASSALASSQSSTVQCNPPPSTPPSRQSTLVADVTPYAAPVRENSFRTRYMNMLLSLDTIPRLHNILASFFGWILLAGFVVFPGTFTGLQKLQDSAVIQQNAAASDILDRVQSLPLLALAALCCGIGYLGSLWLSIRWRNNYVWLLNRLYMPGILNALAGLISTLTSIYSQHGGTWGVTAKVAVSVESVTFVLYLVLFLVYKTLLLNKVKEEHLEQMRGRSEDTTLKAKLENIAKQPPVAPGSVV